MDIAVATAIYICIFSFGFAITIAVGSLDKPSNTKRDRYVLYNLLVCNSTMRKVVLYLYLYCNVSCCIEDDVNFLLSA